MYLFVAIYSLTHPIIAKWNTPRPNPDSYLITLASTLLGQTKECSALILLFFFNSLFFFVNKRYGWNAICFTWRSRNSGRSTESRGYLYNIRGSRHLDTTRINNMYILIKRNLSIKGIPSNIHFFDTFLAAVICHYSRKSPNVSCTNDTADTRQN